MGYICTCRYIRLQNHFSREKRSRGLSRLPAGFCCGRTYQTRSESRLCIQPLTSYFRRDTQRRLARNLTHSGGGKGGVGKAFGEEAGFNELLSFSCPGPLEAGTVTLDG